MRPPHAHAGDRELKCLPRPASRRGSGALRQRQRGRLALMPALGCGSSEDASSLLPRSEPLAQKVLGRSCSWCSKERGTRGLRVCKTREFSRGREWKVDQTMLEGCELPWRRLALPLGTDADVCGFRRENSASRCRRKKKQRHLARSRGGSHRHPVGGSHSGRLLSCILGAGARGTGVGRAGVSSGVCPGCADAVPSPGPLVVCPLTRVCVLISS